MAVEPVNDEGKRMRWSKAAHAAHDTWGDTDLLITLYSDGQNHLLMIQPPWSGQIPPPHIGTMAYMGEYHPTKLNGQSALEYEREHEEEMEADGVDR